MRILLWLRDDDRVALGAPGIYGKFARIACQSADSVRAEAQYGQIACFVLDTTLAADLLRDPGAQTLLSSAPVVMRTALSVNAARVIVDTAAWMPQGRISLHGFDDLASDIAEAVAEQIDSTPALRLIRSMGGSVAGTLRVPIVATTLLGRRRTHLDVLARACGMSPRTIEWRLHRHSSANVRGLLGWSMALHTMWRLDILEWPLKRCAGAAGFADGSTLSDYVERHVGRRPHGILAAGGFDALHRDWRTLLRETGIAHPDPTTR